MEIEQKPQQAYLIGGGIASLASAAYLIRDGNFDGKNISIFEETDEVGGSLDGRGSPETGYIARGGRMFSEEIYNCTFDLFSFIPLNKKTSRTLLDDFVDFNKEIKINAKARLIQEQKIIDSSNFGLNTADKLNMIKTISLPEYFLGNSMISDHFSLSFFKTNFWLEWCTTFAFEPWHSAVEFKRYVLRFIQEFPRMNTMTGIRFTRYNQYESVIIPITNWLEENGVNFLTGSPVSSLKFAINDIGKEKVEKIIFSQKGEQKELSVEKKDLVFFTNGSMITNSTFGNMTSAPVIKKDDPSNSWALWKDISKGRPHFGNPTVFNDQIDRSKWESFSVTFRDQTFVDLMKNFTKNEPGTGGMTTIKDSNWLITVVTPPQPHFINQPDNITVFWGYGLFPDKEGNYVHKKMSECNGKEIMTEVCSHLGFTEKIPEILRSTSCVPCMMPYITSQFMPRKKGDRPLVVLKGTSNFAFIGQFCEIPGEIVFTVENSVRSAIIAVRELLGIKKDIPPIYQGKRDPKIMKELFRMVFK